MKEQKPHTREFVIRCRAAQIKVEQSKILDDFISATGSNRKYAIGILWRDGNPTPPPERETGQGVGPERRAAAVKFPSSGRTAPPWPAIRGLELLRTSDEI